MTDRRIRRQPTPHLHTRPATMITAIGLCLLIMLMQLVPQLQTAHTQAVTATTPNSVR
ncbi:hypothetical protein [Reyranella sp.]|uniref:hypothetical protein n=1 Tax=Reyranella sp. TaxID=1929291 RepID=UPI002F947CA6